MPAASLRLIRLFDLAIPENNRYFAAIVPAAFEEVTVRSELSRDCSAPFVRTLTGLVAVQEVTLPFPNPISLPISIVPVE